MKRISFVLAIMLMILPVFFISCRKDKKSNEEKVQIVIYTPAEETQFQLYQKRLAEKFPAYGFGQNKGYGSAAHMQAISQYGATKWHRRSYEPVKSMALAPAPLATNELYSPQDDCHYVFNIDA